MHAELKQLVDEAINLELNACHLYRIFSEAFPEDAGFWWQLSMEESNHAALLKTGVDYFMDQGLFPYEMLAQRLDDLQAINHELNELIQQFTGDPPTRQIAFWTAMKVERSAGEAHFQNMMSNCQGLKMLELFQKLNGDDKDHAERITAYMKSKNIKEPPFGQ